MLESSPLAAVKIQIFSAVSYDVGAGAGAGAGSGATSKTPHQIIMIYEAMGSDGIDAAEGGVRKNRCHR